MAADDEPVLRIAVRDYVDREVARASRESERHFVTIESARVIAETAVNARLEEMNNFREENRRNTLNFVRQDVHDKDMEKVEALILPLTKGAARFAGATTFGAFTLERLMALAAIAIAVYAVLR